MDCSYLNKTNPGSWRSQTVTEVNRKLPNLHLNNKSTKDPKLSLKHIVIKHKNSLGMRQISKLMVPKSALKVLKEFKGIQVSDLVITDCTEGGFTATINVNSKKYEAIGRSKKLAKDMVCELALREYVKNKMNDSTEAEVDTEKDVAMLNLASFAIHKLYAEWEHQDEINCKKDFMRGSKLPANWKTMHPTNLLDIMRPGLKYKTQEITSTQNQIVFGLTLTVDNREFSSQGRSKKIARRLVAINACNALFNTNFKP